MHIQTKILDAIIIGVDNSDQLLSNIEWLEINSFSELISKVNHINVRNKMLLNPVNWKKMNVVAIIQARNGSLLDLPNKIFLKLSGNFLLYHVVQRPLSLQLKSIIL